MVYLIGVLMSAIPVPNPRDEVIKRLEAIRARSSYSFRLVQSVLRAYGLETAAGWNQLIANYQSLDYSKVSVSSCLSVLDYLYSSSICASNAAVWVWNISPEDAGVLISKTHELISDKSLFYSSFPYPIDNGVLMSAPYNGEFVGRYDEHQDIILFSCSKRAYRSRESISLQDLPIGARQSFYGFDELIGIKSGYIQAFDRVVISPAGRLELHLDMCCNMSVEDMEQYKNYYVKLLKAFAERVLGSPAPWFDFSINFFPKIVDLYNDPDGEVLALEHTTSTKSVKGERMRSRKLDLRKEAFHVEGMKSIPSTDIFAIKKGWKTRSVGDHSYSISIPGKLPSAGGALGFTRYILVEGCLDFSEFEMAVSKAL